MLGFQADLSGFLTLISLSLANASLAYMLTKTSLLDPLTDRLNPEGRTFGFLTCPFCMGHWTGALLAFLASPFPLTAQGLTLWAIVTLMIATVSFLIVQVIVLNGEMIARLRRS